jgi:hypothetical protein
MNGMTVKELIKELEELNPDEVVGVWYCVKKHLENEISESDTYTMDMLTPHLLKKLWHEVNNSDYVWEGLWQAISENLNSLLEEATDPDEQELWEK